MEKYKQRQVAYGIRLESALRQILPHLTRYSAGLQTSIIYDIETTIRYWATGKISYSVYRLCLQAQSLKQVYDNMCLDPPEDGEYTAPYVGKN